MINHNKHPFGVNVLGYFKYQFGIAELARLIVKCLETAAIPYVINNIELPRINSVDLHHRIDEAESLKEDTHNIYNINIICACANEITDIILQKGITYFHGKYNIGVWAWETECFSGIPINFFIRYFNEIWTISRFCKDAISRSILLPIYVIQ